MRHNAVVDSCVVRVVRMCPTHEATKICTREESSDVGAVSSESSDSSVDFVIFENLTLNEIGQEALSTHAVEEEPGKGYSVFCR